MKAYSCFLFASVLTIALIPFLRTALSSVKTKNELTTLKTINLSGILNQLFNQFWTELFR